MKCLISMMALLALAVIAQADTIDVGEVNLDSDIGGGVIDVSLVLAKKSKNSVYIMRVAIWTSIDEYAIDTTLVIVSSDNARELAALLIEAADLIDAAPSREALRRGHESIGEIVGE